MTPYYSSGGPVILGITLLFITIVWLPKLAPKDERRFLTSILLIAVVLKMIATGTRLFMNNVVYRGGDFNNFSRAGEDIAELIRQSKYAEAFSGFGLGTGAMEVVVGVVYSIAGSSFYGVFFIGGYIGFLSAVLFYRAFRVAFPDSNYRLFSYLIFFYPSVLYWPTGLGKDTITFFGLSLTVFGASYFILKLRISGLFYAVLGITIMFVIRPEVGLMAAIAFITAFVLRRPAANRRAFTVQLIGVPTIMMAGFIFISSATSFLGIEELSLNSALNVVTEQSATVLDEGRTGSNFQPPQVGTPTWIPEAFMTVLFRPFAWEVHNFTSMIQSFDGLFMGLILGLSGPRLIRNLKDNGRNPIIVFSIVFMLMTVIALATLGNFGLLARQRVIVLPCLFMLIAASKAVEKQVRRRRRKQPFEPRPANDPVKTPQSGLAGASAG